jgi:murein L,D-transpeptidase YafK
MKKKELEFELKFHNPNRDIFNIKSSLEKPTYTQVETQKEGKKKNLSSSSSSSTTIELLLMPKVT